MTNHLWEISNESRGQSRMCRKVSFHQMIGQYLGSVHEPITGHRATADATATAINPFLDAIVHGVVARRGER